MKRDWEVIREVLIELEELNRNQRLNKTYGLGDEYSDEESTKNEQALLLWKAGFISGIDATTFDGPALINPDMTWEGHDLLDTLRSKAIWERIKTTAKEKGIELTFDSVKALGKVALDWAIAS